VAYTLHPVNGKKGYEWRVKEGLTIGQGLPEELPVEEKLKTLQERLDKLEKRLDALEKRKT
jgi:hypothetical protein